MARRANASAWTARRGRRPQHVRKLLAREPGDLASGQDQKKPGPHREGDEPKPVMHGDEKSDPSIVAGKPANGLGRPGPELVEQREGAKENTGQAGTRRTPSRASVSPGLDRVRTASPSNIQGGSRMRECRTSGSVRGVLSNGHPYRNRHRQDRGLRSRRGHLRTSRSSTSPKLQVSNF